MLNSNIKIKFYFSGFYLIKLLRDLQSNAIDKTKTSHPYYVLINLIIFSVLLSQNNNLIELNAAWTMIAIKCFSIEIFLFIYLIYNPDTSRIKLRISGCSMRPYPAGALPSPHTMLPKLNEKNKLLLKIFER